jgi:hypothetical protein
LENNESFKYCEQLIDETFKYASGSEKIIVGNSFSKDEENTFHTKGKDISEKNYLQYFEVNSKKYETIEKLFQHILEQEKIKHKKVSTNILDLSLNSSSFKIINTDQDKSLPSYIKYQKQGKF